MNVPCRQKSLFDIGIFLILFIVLKASWKKWAISKSSCYISFNRADMHLIFESIRKLSRLRWNAWRIQTYA